MVDTRPARSPHEVLEDHLRLSKCGSVEEDLARNYATDVLLLTTFGVWHGWDGMRFLAQLLREQLPGMRFDYRTRFVEGEVGFLEWTACADHTEVKDGADSYLIRDGRIVAQTIHYTVLPRARASRDGDQPRAS